MDRAMIERHLAMVERHVAMGLLQVARQLEIVARLQRRGDAALAADASQLLTLFEEMQVEHEAHRDRLWRKLQEAK